MKKHGAHGFTLIEVITVIAIIVTLTGIVIGLSGFIQRQGAFARAKGEMAMLEAACRSYHAEYESFPQNEDTDELKPTEDFDPTKEKYSKANLHLYRELTGDREPHDKPDFQYTDEDKESKRFLKDFEPRILATEKDKQTKKILSVKFIQDPFGFPYGYSTAAAKAEQDFQKDLRRGQRSDRKAGKEIGGFNGAWYDLWSTAGNKLANPPGAGKPQELEWAKWIKNW